MIKAFVKMISSRLARAVCRRGVVGWWGAGLGLGRWRVGESRGVGGGGIVGVDRCGLMGDIKRHFGVALEKRSKTMKAEEGENERKEEKQINREYDEESTLEYFTFLLLDPLKHEILINRLKRVFMNCKPETRDRVIKQVNIMFKLRVAYHELAHSAWQETPDSLRAKVSEDQRKMMVREFKKFCDALATASLELTPSEACSLFVNLCMVRLSLHPLWITLIPTILRNVDKLTFEEVDNFIRCLRLVTNNYSMIEGHTRYNQNFMLMEENYLRDVIAFSQMANFVDNMATRLNDSPILEQVEAHYRFMLLIGKFIKFSGVSGPHKKMYLDRLISKLYPLKNSLENLSLKKVQTLFFLSKLIIGQGRNTPLVLELVKIATMNLLRNPETDKFKMALISIATKNVYGDFDIEMFRLVETPLLIKRLEDKSDKIPIGDVTVILWSLYGMKSDNFKLHELVIDHLPTLDDVSNQLKNERFQLKSIHQLLSYGISNNIIPKKLIPRVSQLANQLTAYCICAQHNIMFDKLMPEDVVAQIPEVVNGKDASNSDDHLALLECTNHPASKDFILGIYNEPAKQKQQLYDDNYNELVIKEATTIYSAKYLEAKIEFRYDLKSISACSYKWDGVFIVEGVEPMIGFEITGQAYSSEYTGYQLKKQFKFGLLAKKNYIPVIIAVGDSKTKSNILASNLEALGIEVIYELRKQIKEYTGVDLKIREAMLDEYNEKLAEYEQLNVQFLSNSTKKILQKDLKITAAPKMPQKDNTSLTSS